MEREKGGVSASAGVLGWIQSFAFFAFFVVGFVSVKGEPVAAPNRRPASPYRIRRVSRTSASLPTLVPGGGR